MAAMMQVSMKELEFMSSKKRAKTSKIAGLIADKVDHFYSNNIYNNNHRETKTNNELLLLM